MAETLEPGDRSSSTTTAGASPGCCSAATAARWSMCPNCDIGLTYHLRPAPPAVPLLRSPARRAGRLSRLRGRGIPARGRRHREGGAESAGPLSRGPDPAPGPRHHPPAGQPPAHPDGLCPARGRHPGGHPDGGQGPPLSRGGPGGRAGGRRRPGPAGLPGGRAVLPAADPGGRPVGAHRAGRVVFQT